MFNIKKNADTYQGTFVIWLILTFFVVFFIWSSIFKLDQFVRAQGKIFSKSRTQQIQAVDGGVLEEIFVKEGDLVEVGQIIAKINSKRFEASSNEIRAKVDALRSKITRLKAEINGEPLDFDRSLLIYAKEIVDIETTLYKSRKISLDNDISALKKTLSIAQVEEQIVLDLKKTGDVDQMEVLNARKAVIDNEAKLQARYNEYIEKASSELVDARDQLDQSLQILNQRTDLVENSDVVAQVTGYVKNINATTQGAVLQAGEQLMEIVPTNDVLLLEAKVTPTDIADLAIGQLAKLRLDPFDSSIYGSINVEVIFISAGTVIDEQSKQKQEEPYYVVHLSIPTNPVSTSIGKEVELIADMTGQVDIKTGNRSVLNYLLKPIFKTLNQSFGER